MPHLAGKTIQYCMSFDMQAKNYTQEFSWFETSYCDKFLIMWMDKRPPQYSQSQN